MIVAADIDQKPPMTTPTSALPAMKIAALGARATTRPDTIISPAKPSKTSRRSSLRVTDEMNRLVSTAKTPETAIACPAWPWVTWRSAAIGVRRLTGMNSEVIRVKTHRVSAPTAPQAPVWRVGASA
jgi:hypothetical protein